MNTRTKILDLAQAFSQRAGFRGFAYKDIAQELGIKPAAVHYHFPKKEDLGEALAERYVSELKERLNAAADRPGRERLELFVELFRNTILAGKLCLCASIATDSQVLPATMTIHARSFFDFAERWLYEAIKDGQRGGSVASERDALELAAEYVALVYGAMLLNQGAARLDAFDAVLARWARVNLGK